MREVIRSAYRELAIAVILQAMQDVRSTDPMKALDAALWLMGEDAPLFLDEIEINGDLKAWLIAGAKGKLAVRGKEAKINDNQRGETF